MSKDKVFPMSECVTGGVYLVRVNGNNVAAAYDGSSSFIYVIENSYGKNLLAVPHQNNATGVYCEPLSFCGMLPENTSLETNFGLVCDTCGEPVSPSNWEHTTVKFAAHKPTATWKKNFDLIERLSSYEE